WRVVSFLSLYWKHPDVFLPYYGLDVPEVYLRDAAAIRACFDLWADAFSKQEYCAQLRWRLQGDFQAVSKAASYTPYVHTGLFRNLDEEFFVDCGAFTGDTIQSFLEERGGVFGGILGFEPDPANYRKLQNSTANLPPEARARSNVFPYAVSDD